MELVSTASAAVTVNDIPVEIDPLGKFSSYAPEAVLESCGIVPLWLNRQQPFKESIENNYGFGSLFDMQGGTVHPDGRYSYPQDPDLFPLMKAESDTEIFFMYQYAIVAIVNKATGDAFVTRVD